MGSVTGDCVLVWDFRFIELLQPRIAVTLHGLSLTLVVVDRVFVGVDLLFKPAQVLLLLSASSLLENAVTFVFFLMSGLVLVLD